MITPLPVLPSPKSHVYCTLVPPEVAVNQVVLPNSVGLCSALSVLISSSVTVITMSAGALAKPRASVTTSVKVNTSGTAGATNVADIPAAPLSVTGEPPLCVQYCVNGKWPSGSVLAELSSVTVRLTRTVADAPGCAMGAALVMLTSVAALTLPTPFVVVTRAV